MFKQREIKGERESRDGDKIEKEGLLTLYKMLTVKRKIEEVDLVACCMPDVQEEFCQRKISCCRKYGP